MRHPEWQRWLAACQLGLCAVLVAGTGHDVRGAQAAGTQQTPPGAAPAAPAAGRASPFVPPEPLDYRDRSGWTEIFDGRTLAGWSGNPDVWSVAGGAMTAVSTAERRVGSTHIIWAGGEPGDFELKLEIQARRRYPLGDCVSQLRRRQPWRRRSRPFGRGPKRSRGAAGRASGSEVDSVWSRPRFRLRPQDGRQRRRPRHAKARGRLARRHGPGRERHASPRGRRPRLQQTLWSSQGKI